MASNEIITFVFMNLTFIDDNEDCSNYMLIEDCNYETPKFLDKLCNNLKKSRTYSSSGQRMCLTLKRDSLKEKFSFDFYFFSEKPLIKFSKLNKAKKNLINLHFF